jgi:predicted RNA binding protein YcfA (HicA-like mRNA interferase family)
VRGPVIAIVVPEWYYCSVPPKIRELIRDLESVGFENRGGKGSHRNFRHRKGINITLSGRPGDDAKRYQIRDVKRAVELIGNEEK